MSVQEDALAGALTERLGDRLVDLRRHVGEITIRVAPGHLIEAARVLRDDPALAFDTLIDLCGVDYLGYGEDEWKTEPATSSGFSRGVSRSHGSPDAQQDGRFAVVYHLLSVELNHRLRVRVVCEEADYPRLDSVADVWPSANWFEREAFDLFGILFEGHPDLRRLLTDYGFVGHPFRKDFPLSGNVEVRYDPERGRVVYEPVSIEPRTLVPRVIRDDARYVEPEQE